MTRSFVLLRTLPTVIAVGLLGLGLAAQAQTEASPPAQSEVRSPTRLSDHLQSSSTALKSNPDALGLVWTTPEELQRQWATYQQIQAQLDSLRRADALTESTHRSMTQLLRGLPPTGRVRTPAANPEWLQSKPRRDPLLQPGDSVGWPPERPRAVRVLNERGLVCQVPHRSGLQARDYLLACPEMEPGDWAWVVQPDGRVQQHGLGWWNPARQDYVGPGAWVWAPSASLKGRVPAAFHQAWAEWLATQGASTTQPLSRYPDATQQARPAAPQSDPWDLRGRHHDPLPSANNWGNVGLIQTPTARMRTEGHVGVSFHWFYPYRSFNVMFQPFSWMEMGFRYVDELNRLYSPYAEFSGDTPNKDKSLDLKLRVLREDQYAPEVAVGWRDLAGTGLFSS